MLPSVDIQSATEPYQEIGDDLNIDNAPNYASDNDCDNLTKFVAYSIFLFYALSGALMKTRCWEFYRSVGSPYLRQFVP